MADEVNGVSQMVRTSFIDPRRIKEKNVGGPYYIEGWTVTFKSGGTRLFDEERTTMWFAEIVYTCWYEGLNYDGHKIG